MFYSSQVCLIFDSKIIIHLLSSRRNELLQRFYFIENIWRIHKNINQIGYPQINPFLPWTSTNSCTLNNMKLLSWSSIIYFEVSTSLICIDKECRGPSTTHKIIRSGIKYLIEKWTSSAKPLLRKKSISKGIFSKCAVFCNICSFSCVIEKRVLSETNM